MMASSSSSSTLTFSNLQDSQILLHHKSRFLGQKNHLHNAFRVFPCTMTKTCRVRIQAKFDLFEIMGGRGLLNGEKGVSRELLKTNLQGEENNTNDTTSESEAAPLADGNSEPGPPSDVPDKAFEKELLGLTGGFPGGEKGLKRFIEENPPPKKSVAAATPTGGSASQIISSSKKPKAPELPLLMPGMIVIVNNPNHPFYMYCGIIQRITDGKAGVLFEGGNWDRLITFRLEELERREKGPPMKNPRSCVLEPLLENESS